MIIEMMKKYVTSYAEVWIEMEIHVCLFEDCQVTSYAEVWIEITGSSTVPSVYRHLLRGGVD